MREDHEGPEAGAVLGGFYRLEHKLGEGGFGQVWRAIDERDQRPVAIKLLSSSRVKAAGWYEAHVMRQVTLSGAVKLLDEGLDLTHQVSFLVMNLVDGEPFPGRRAPIPWQELMPLAARLMRTLQHLHALGILHLDLKPSNVLVNLETGEVTLLDFGLSRKLLSDALTEGIAGTPQYLSPEQLRRQPTSPQSDIYSLGVMLYEALTGELPRRGDSLRQQLRAMLTQPWVPMRDHGVEVPARLEQLVEQMLSIEPHARPATLGEVLQHMEQTAPERSNASSAALERMPERLLRLGFSAELEALAQHARPWHLRVSALHQDRDTLGMIEALREMLSLEVCRLAESALPFGSVLDALGERPEAQDTLTRRELVAWVLARLDARQDRVWVVEQERVDPWSWQLLVGVSRGRFICLSPRLEAAPLATLSPDSLVTLFSGTELWVNHLSRAARALHARTAGELFAVARTLREWTELELVSDLHEPPRYLVNESCLRKIERGERRAFEGHYRLDLEALEGETGVALLTWVMIASGELDAARCAALMARPLWEVEAWIEVLAARGILSVSPQGGWLWAEALYSPLEVWSSAELEQNHRRVAEALAPHDPNRIAHLLQAGERERALREVLHVAEELRLRGDFYDAVSMLEEMARVARLTQREESLRPLLELWAKVVVDAESVEFLERYLLMMSKLEIGGAEQIVELLTCLRLQASRSNRSFDYDYLRGMFPETLETPWLEVLRLQILYRASTPSGQAAAFLEEVAPWFASQAPDVARRLKVWRAMHARDQGRFEQSAELHAGGILGSTPERYHYSDLCDAYNAVLMWCDALEYERAASMWASHRWLAELVGGPTGVRYLYMGRRLGYVLGETLGEEPDLEGLCQQVVVSTWEGTVRFCEAAIAWRGGARDRAAAHARRGEQLWRNFGYEDGVMLMHALCVAIDGEEVRWSDEEVLSRLAAMRWPRLVVQSAGLLVLGRPHLREALAPLASQRLDEVPRAHWGRRLEVISIDEAMRNLGVEGA